MHISRCSGLVGECQWRVTCGLGLKKTKWMWQSFFLIWENLKFCMSDSSSTDCHFDKPNVMSGAQICKFHVNLYVKFMYIWLNSYVWLLSLLHKCYRVVIWQLCDYNFEISDGFCFSSCIRLILWLCVLGNNHCFVCGCWWRVGYGSPWTNGLP